MFSLLRNPIPLMLTLILVVTLSSAYSRAQAQGELHAEWCLTGATKRIAEQSMNNGYCARYVAGWGFKHQNQLARDAITAIYCENNLGRALEYLRVCQCHNKGVHNSLEGWAESIRQWGMRRGGELKVSCPVPDPPVVVSPPTPQPISAQCVCQYSNGTIGAWFSSRPQNFGATGSVDVAASSCANLSVCERTDTGSGYSYKFLTGTMKINGSGWAENINLITGASNYVLWGTLGQ